MTNIETIYIPQQNSDMTEGRGPMVEMDGFYTTEEAAWEFIGNRPGVMGRRPPAGKMWKDAQYMGDYAVRKVKRSINDAAEPLPTPGAFIRDTTDNSQWRTLMAKRISRGTAIVLAEDEHRVYGVGFVFLADFTFKGSPDEFSFLEKAIENYTKRKS